MWSGVHLSIPHKNNLRYYIKQQDIKTQIPDKNHDNAKQISSYKQVILL